MMLNMRVTIAFVVALLAVSLPTVIAQGNSSSSGSTSAALPSCARSCLLVSIANSNCAPTDQRCVCTNEELQVELTECVLSKCTVKESLVAKNSSETTCQRPIRDRGTQFNTMSTIMVSFAGGVVVLRLLYKLLVLRVELGMDDWFILLTAIAGVPSAVINSQGTIANGLGRDIWTLTPDQITNFGRFFYVMAILYFAEVTLLKMSLLFFYLRIFPDRDVRRILWGTIIANALIGVIFCLVAIFQCRPIHYYWTKWDGEHAGACLDINRIAWSNAALSIALDLWMLGVPLWQLRTLQIDWKKKIGVGIMFGVGTFVTIVSILRLHALVSFASTFNPTWDHFDTSNWSTIEISVGMICACLPTVRLMLVRIFPFLGGSSARSTGAYHGPLSRSKGEERSRTGGFTSVVSGKSGQHREDANGILYQKSYDVHHGDHDEASLVQMRDFRAKTTTPKTSTRSNASDISV